MGPKNSHAANTTEPLESSIMRTHISRLMASLAPGVIIAWIVNYRLITRIVPIETRHVTGCGVDGGARTEQRKAISGPRSRARDEVSMEAKQYGNERLVMPEEIHTK